MILPYRKGHREFFRTDWLKFRAAGKKLIVYFHTNIQVFSICTHVNDV